MRHQNQTVHLSNLKSTCQKKRRDSLLCSTMVATATTQLGCCGTQPLSLRFRCTYFPARFSLPNRWTRSNRVFAVATDPKPSSTSPSNSVKSKSVNGASTVIFYYFDFLIFDFLLLTYFNNLINGIAENWRSITGNKKSEGTDGRKWRSSDTDERSSGSESKGFTVCWGWCSASPCWGIYIYLINLLLQFYCAICMSYLNQTVCSYILFSDFVAGLK